MQTATIHRTLLAMTPLLLCACVTLGAAPATSASACGDSPVLELLCGAERPEDLARIGDTPWLVASGFARGAGLKLVDTRSRTLTSWFDGAQHQIDHDGVAFPDCPVPPSITEFTSRGVSLRITGFGRGTLHVVNHGGRERIDVFSVDWRYGPPRLAWRGCIPLPDGLVANSVATFSDGNVLFTVLTRPGTTITDFVAGRITGGVYSWRPGQTGVTLLPGTELRGNNGLETAHDDRSFFVVAFGSREVVKYDRDDTATPLARATAPGFMPDNIHWDGGRLIAAGMTHDEPACGGVRRIISGVADTMQCRRGYVVAELDPVTMEFRTLAYGEPDPAFNGVSAAVIVEQDLWLGSYQDDRLAVRRLPYPLPPPLANNPR